jgi:phosphoribosylglycinamide formyltransferase-1
MKNLVCLVSGRGSNLEAILRAQVSGNWERDPGARIAAVISNRPKARGLEIARGYGVDAHVVDHEAFGSREQFDAALERAIAPYQPALVVLAGFLRVLTPGFVSRFEGRLINIHPSLLPAFAGLCTHRRALAAGVRVHGTTVHYVSGELDSGPIIAQAGLRVRPGEDEEELAARVLALEHELFPRCVRWIAQGSVQLVGGAVVLDPALDRAELFRFVP